MKIALKFFLGAALIFFVSGALGLKYLQEEITPRYREAVEEQLVDLARLFAEILSQSQLKPDVINQIMENVTKSRFRAAIFGIEKNSVDLRITITNDKGIVLVDSHDPAKVGTDYSGWRDFALTVRGEYGARTTRDNPRDPNSTVLYVASPILKDGTLVGVLTIGKPTKNFKQFISRTSSQLGLRVFYICSVGLVCIIILSSVIVTRPLKQLAKYARTIADGDPAIFPALPHDEVGALGDDFERMRRSLEGHRYIEEYIQALTHELKSPLTGIQGALEVVVENRDPAIAKRFTDNIRADLQRMTKLVERMLTLSSIEARNSLEVVEEFSLNALLISISNEVREKTPRVAVKLTANDELTFSGDKFLLGQAVRNLVENAIDFARTEVVVSLFKREDRAYIVVKDDGQGIPDFALSRIFERFYSLPRPDTEKKSTGLGLCFCMEVVRLHGGELTVLNDSDGGAKATIIL